jgi:tRNA G10  N-methylase Trm11
MKKYIFVLGRNPELSYVELISYFKNYDIKYKKEYLFENIVVFSLDKFNIDISRLGGTVKIAEVVMEDKVKEINFYQGDKNKINYAVSVFGKNNFNGFGEFLKKWFKKEKIKAMLKKNIESIPSKDVLEFVICDQYLGRVIEVSNPKEYKKRDNDRMHNDFVRSISIRLAKILINLTQIKKGERLLDPFCGVGVLLEECLNQNIKCVGVEIDDKIRMEAMKNLKNFNSKGDFKVFKGDSSKINQFLPLKINCVASEPYLGPYFKTYPKKGEVIKVVKELNGLYMSFFANLKKVLEKNGRVVMIMPVFRASNKKTYRLDLDKIFRKAGFKIASLDEIQFPLKYEEKRSIVGREIYVLE